MTETVAVGAVNGISAPGGVAWQISERVDATPDPSSVDRFQAAMGVDGPKDVDPIPFASEASAAWRMAQENNQGILHRIMALSELGLEHGPGARELIELQYEVMNLSFQQEVVTKVADKASNAVQTLIKNQ